MYTTGAPPITKITVELSPCAPFGLCGWSSTTAMTVISAPAIRTPTQPYEGLVISADRPSSPFLLLSTLDTVSTVTGLLIAIFCLTSGLACLWPSRRRARRPAFAPSRNEPPT